MAAWARSCAFPYRRDREDSKKLEDLLRYELRYSALAREALERWEKLSGKESQVLLDWPVVQGLEAQDSWNAFQFLGNSRQFGFETPQKVLVSEMLIYADRRGITDLEEFITIIQHLDHVWYEVVVKKDG